MRRLGAPLVSWWRRAQCQGSEATTLPCASWTRFFSSSSSKNDLPESLLPVVAIVGRPNVGKSALFNRLLRRKEALVYNTPGGHVTRDYQEGVGHLGDLKFKVLDTSGLEPSLPSGSIQARAAALTARVLNKSDVALFLVDGRTGVLPSDQELAKWMRKNIRAAVVLAANKCERRGQHSEAEVAEMLADAKSLGYGEPVAFSAETGEGMAELYEALRPAVDSVTEARWEAVKSLQEGEGSQSEPEGGTGEGGEPSGPLKIAIMGLPNVGKSTLTNYLLGDERCLTGPEPGLTRDAIKTRLEYKGQSVELVDTAGWIRRAKLGQYDDSGGAVAAQTVEEGRSVMQFVHVVALVVDACRALEHREGLTHREMQLASDVVAEGRALVLVANKLDALPEVARPEALNLISSAVERGLPEVSGVPLLGMSALTGQGAGRFMPSVLHQYRQWNKRVPTSQINRWLEQKAAEYEHSGGGKEVNRVRYISQVKARPPSFVAFVSGGKELSEASRRFLLNLLRRQFGFGGVPLRLSVRYNKRQRL